MKISRKSDGGTSDAEEPADTSDTSSKDAAPEQGTAESSAESGSSATTEPATQSEPAKSAKSAKSPRSVRSARSTKTAGDADQDSASRRPGAGAAVAKMRTTVAKVVAWVFALIALFLAVGVLLVAMRHNVTSTNPVVELVHKVCEVFDGPFKRDGTGVFSFTNKKDVLEPTKNALTNWGLAAILYLVIGRVLSRVIRP